VRSSVAGLLLLPRFVAGEIFRDAPALSSASYVTKITAYSGANVSRFTPVSQSISPRQKAPWSLTSAPPQF